MNDRTRICQCCNQEFRRRRLSEDQKYCSRACANKARPIAHGTLYAYQKRHCRCDQCKKANAAYHKACRKKRNPSAAPQHGLYTTYSNWRCRCEPCSNAWAEHLRHDYGSRQSRTDQAPHGTRSGYVSWGCRCEQCRAVGLKLSRARFRRTQDALVPQAVRRFAEWTGPELEIASRPDLTHRQVAIMLGRTYAGVRHKRRLLEVDLKTTNLAGIAPPKPSPVIFGHQVTDAIKRELA